MDYQREQFWPKLVRQFVFGVAFDLLIAFALVMIFGSESGWQGEVAVVFLGIVALGLALDLKNWMAKGVWAHLFGQRFIEQSIFEMLKATKLPAPKEYHCRGFSYLADLADDENANPNDRVQAAMLYSALSTAWAREGVLRAAAYQRAADNAVSRWVSQLPSR